MSRDDLRAMLKDLLAEELGGRRPKDDRHRGREEREERSRSSTRASSQAGGDVSISSNSSKGYEILIFKILLVEVINSGKNIWGSKRILTLEQIDDVKIINDICSYAKGQITNKAMIQFDTAAILTIAQV